MEHKITSTAYFHKCGALMAAGRRYAEKVNLHASLCYIAKYTEVNWYSSYRKTFKSFHIYFKQKYVVLFTLSLYIILFYSSLSPHPPSRWWDVHLLTHNPHRKSSRALKVNYSGI